jgi:hypothetical protein
MRPVDICATLYSSPVVRILVSGLAAVPWAVAWIASGVRPDLAESPWPVAIAAGVPAIAVLAWQRRQIVLFVVAFALAGVAGYAGGHARVLWDVGDEDGWPRYDLTQAPLPEELPGYVALVGYYHDDLKLREYAVEDGDLPKQSERAEAVLVPFVGDREALGLPGRIVIARVDADELVQAASPRTIRGKVEPVDPELLGTLVHGGAGADGILVDTLNKPTPRALWTNLAIAGIAVLIAFGCLWFATAAEPASP